MAKLYLVVRADLSLGQQAVQAIHAQVQFAKEHPETERSWHKTSNTIALLKVPDEEALHLLLEKAEQRGLRCSLFREPDRCNELTAIALEPEARKLCSGLTLAFS